MVLLTYLLTNMFVCEGAYRVEVTVELSVELVKATNISNASSTYASNSLYTRVVAVNQTH